MTRKVAQSIRLQYGAQLKAMRKRAGLTQEYVARKCGVHVSYVCRFEKGTSDSLSLYMSMMSVICAELKEDML